MQPLKKAVLPEPTSQQLNGFRQFAKAYDMSEQDIQEAISMQYECEIWMNDVYQVNLRHIESDLPIVHISIKRRDKEPIRDWRDFQAIKNQLVGPECEAIELYPAESRLIDTANQYHLWAVADTEFRFPMGFSSGRLVTDKDYGTGSKQRNLKSCS